VKKGNHSKGSNAGGLKKGGLINLPFGRGKSNRSNDPKDPYMARGCSEYGPYSSDDNSDGQPKV